MSLQIKGELYPWVTNETIRTWLDSTNSKIEIGDSFGVTLYGGGYCTCDIYLLKHPVLGVVDGTVELIMDFRDDVIMRMEIIPTRENLSKVIVPRPV
jgi:hypothetical protein